MVATTGGFICVYVCVSCPFESYAMLLDYLIVDFREWLQKYMHELDS